MLNLLRTRKIIGTALWLASASSAVLPSIVAQASFGWGDLASRRDSARAERKRLCAELLERGTAGHAANGVGANEASGDRPRYVSREYWALDHDLKRKRTERKEIEHRLADDESPTDDRTGGWDYDDSDWEPRVPLSEAEKAEMRAKIEKLQGKEKLLEEALAKQSAADQRALFELVSAKAKTNQHWARGLSDIGAAGALSKLDPGKTVAIVAGNAQDEVPAQVRAEVLALAKDLSGRGYTVLYDADTLLAEAIREVTGGRALGLSGRSSKAAVPGVVVIENDYVRMRAYESATRRIVTTDSPTGQGLLVQGIANIVLDANGDWRDSLAHWSSRLGVERKSLGVDYKPVFSVENAHVAATLVYAKGEQEAVFTPITDGSADRNRADVLASVKAMPSRASLQAIAEYGDAMDLADQRLHGVPAGTVLLGSGKMDPRLNRKVYEAAEAMGELNIPVYTGGAGGFMRIGNTGAYAAGADSIGIPIGGRNQLDTEKKVFTDVQTVTVETPDYSSRIQLLLEDKQVIVILPGGRGTMQEIAVALLKFAAHPKQRAYMYLFDNEYYRELFAWIQDSALAPSIKARIKLVDTAAELKHDVRSLYEQGLIKESKLRRPGQPSPRSVSSRQTDFLNPMGFGGFSR